MGKEFAIIKASLEDALEDGNEIVFKNQYPEYILAELIRLDDDDSYIVEEYTVDDDGEFLEGSDFDSAANFRERYGTWYAVCADDDNDWSNGSYNRREAFKMLNSLPACYHIDVIEMGTDPVCVEVLYSEDE